MEMAAAMISIGASDLDVLDGGDDGDVADGGRFGTTQTPVT